MSIKRKNARILLHTTLILVITIGFASINFADWEKNKECVKTWACSGVGTGGCTPQGMVCLDDGCESSDDERPPGTPAACSWDYDASCDTKTGKCCETYSYSYIATDCGPYCKWLVYNTCACACKGKGENTCEGGDVTSCKEKDM